MREADTLGIRAHRVGGVLAFLGLLAACDAPRPPIPFGDLAPTFRTQRLDGSTLDFPKDYRGSVVALRFWADWCPYCKDEMRAIEPVYQRERESGLVVVALNVGQSREVAERFARTLGISYEVALDPEAEVARRYGVNGLPLTYFVDRQGRVRNKILGEADVDVFMGLAKPLLQEQTP